MINQNQIRESISQNINLWIALWVLLLINVFMVLFISRGFSVLLLIFFLTAVLAGTGVLKYLAENRKPRVSEIPGIYHDKTNALMKEIQPLCDDIFTREINKITEPVIEDYRQDITRGLSWLWEDADEFVDQVEQGIDETNSMLQLVNNLSDEKYKIVKNLKENLTLLNNLVDEIRRSKERDYEDLEQCLDSRYKRLQKDMEKEKSIFYDYIHKLLLERIKETDDSEDITEYFDVYKLGEQFSVVMGKSLEIRLAGFQDSLVEELENLSANIVGRMQKSALQLVNTLNLMEGLISQLSAECRGESGVLIRRVKQSGNRIAELKEQAGEKLVTLAWQEILVEKRWHDLKEKLYNITDQVRQNVAEDVIEFIQGVLKEEIPGCDSIAKSPNSALLYKSLIDAECIYRVYAGRNLPDIIDDGVYVLLQFVRPVELVIRKTRYLSQEGLQKRKLIKEEIKAGRFDQDFAKVQHAIEGFDASLGKYVNDIFPGAFLAFCNNPYVKERTDNLSQAAWMLFMSLLDEQNIITDEIYCLVGLLLIIHEIRNAHIQPLKSVPLPLENEGELEDMRKCCYKAVSILITSPFRGGIRL
ncbi:MAG: hypothetical protein ACOX6I_09105 [Syntrophomonadaceae bacterium]|jgi:hypothetical protein